jgi:hypothetical protein
MSNITQDLKDVLVSLNSIIFLILVFRAGVRLDRLEKQLKELAARSKPQEGNDAIPPTQV